MPNKRFSLQAKVTALGNRKGEVMIYSVISDWKGWSDEPNVTSRDFDKALKDLGDVDEITVRINSPGGVVSEAVAIRTALMKHPAKKTIDIEGCCDSAATIIACLPGARVRMAKGADYMIHCCSALVWGNQEKVLSMYTNMCNTDNDMADIYAERTGKTAEECLKLMKAETWYGADDAVKNGFVDEIIEPDDTEEEFVACAVTAETMEAMREMYDHAPERPIIRAQEQDNNNVSNETSAVAAASSTENNHIGRAFNPNKLIAMLYQAGCERAEYLEGSGMNDSLDYTEIAARERCKGTITLTVVNT